MRVPTVLLVVLAACASLPRGSDKHRMLLEGQDPDAAREAALAVVENVAHPTSVVRITEEGKVLTEGRMGVCGKEVTCSTGTAYPGYVSSPWTTIEVRVQDLGRDTAVQVAIEYESCEPGVSCVPERYASSGEMERRILEGIRAHLAGEGAQIPG